MSDLFAEMHAERSAIMQHDGGLPTEVAESMARADVTAQLHACEVRSVVRMYRSAFESAADAGGDASGCKEAGKKKVDAFLVLVAKHRGQAAADRLREDALAALKNK